VLDTAAQSAVDAETARKEGVALHALLQHLGRVPRADWAVVGARAMPVLLPDRPERHEAALARALSILSRPELAHLFGADSRAEVPFLIDAERDGNPVTLAGRIDRLVVTPAEVLVIDFKSDAAPPADPDGIPPAYRRQLTLYALVATRLFPAKIVRPAILWTALESLMFLPEEMLAESAGGFTIR
jgi:ATP-dependent helicase/nuclease subunit A